MIPIQVDPVWSERFPGAHMGVLEACQLPALASHPALERERIALETALRLQFQGMDRNGLRELPVMRAFTAHFKPHGKTYHVLGQLESVALKGRSIPARLCAVTALFMAELKHGLVSAGHDLDNLVSPLRLAPSKGGEHYRNLGGVEVVLPEGDMTLAHGRGLLSSVLQGPDRETNIGSSSTNVLYTIYAPPGLPEGTLEATLDSLSSYVALFAPDALMEKRTFRDQAPARSWHQSGECFSLRSALHPRCSGSIRAWLPETYETDDGCP